MLAAGVSASRKMGKSANNENSCRTSNTNSGTRLTVALMTIQQSNWSIECDVVVRDGDFPDDETTSDHRPIEMTVKLSSQ